MALIALCLVGLSALGSLPKLFNQLAIDSLAQAGQASLVAYSWGSAILGLVAGASSLLVGFAVERAGWARIALAGVASVCAFFFTCVSSGEAIEYSASLAVFGSIGYACLSVVVLGSFITNHVPASRQGLLMACATNGPAIAIVFLPGLAIQLAHGVSWRGVAHLMGIASMSGLFIICAIRSLVQSGDEPGQIPGPYAVIGRRSITESEFRWVVIAFGACGISMTFFDVQLLTSIRLIMGLWSDRVVAEVLRVAGVAEIVGGAIAGIACDRGGAWVVLSSGYVLRATSFLLLVLAPVSHGEWLFVGFGFSFGLSFLMTVTASSYLASGCVSRNPGSALGILWFFHGLAAMSAALFGSSLVQKGAGGVVALSVLFIVLLGGAGGLAGIAALWRSPRSGRNGRGRVDAG